MWRFLMCILAVSCATDGFENNKASKGWGHAVWSWLGSWWYGGNETPLPPAGPRVSCDEQTCTTTECDDRGQCVTRTCGIYDTDMRGVCRPPPGEANHTASPPDVSVMPLPSEKPELNKTNLTHDQSEIDIRHRDNSIRKK